MKANITTKRIIEKTIPVVGFLDKNNLPTCAVNFQTGEFCSFYRTQRMGCHETCLFAEVGDRGIATMLFRRENGQGSLIPCKECPIWRERVEPS
jgi:hypothetical protein